MLSPRGRVSLGHAARGLLEHVHVVGEPIQSKGSLVWLEVNSLALSLLKHDWHSLRHAVLLMLHVEDVAVLFDQGFVGPGVDPVQQLLGTGEWQVLSLVQLLVAQFAIDQAGSLVHWSVGRNGPRYRCLLLTVVYLSNVSFLEGLIHGVL